MGISGLVRAFEKEEKFGGRFEYDLERSVRRLETEAIMCDLPEKEKLQSIPQMLDGEALDYFDDNRKNFRNRKEAFRLLR